MILYSLVALSDISLWVSYVFGFKKCYYIVRVIFILGVYSITWVSQSIGCTNC